MAQVGATPALVLVFLSEVPIMSPDTLHTEHDARRLARVLTDAEHGDEDGWTYEARRAGDSARWYVLALDELGEEAGCL